MGELPGAPAATLIAASKARKDAASLEAEMREDARQMAVGATVGAGLRGSSVGLDRLIGMLETPEGRRLMGGDKARGIAPVAPELIGRLRDARPQAIKQREMDEQEAALVDQELAESIEAMKRRRAKRIREGNQLEKNLNIESGINARAFDAAQRLKGNMGAQVEEKPVQVPPTPVSPFQRRQEAFRRLQGNRAMGIADQIAGVRPDLNPDQVMRAASAASNMTKQGWNQNFAIQRALYMVNQEILRSMQMMAGQQAGLMGGFQQQGQRARGIQRSMQQKRPSLLRAPMGGFGR
jgi:hypothetical protein